MRLVVIHGHTDNPIAEELKKRTSRGYIMESQAEGSGRGVGVAGQQVAVAVALASELEVGVQRVAEVVRIDEVVAEQGGSM